MRICKTKMGEGRKYFTAVKSALGGKPPLSVEGFAFAPLTKI